MTPDTNIKIYLKYISFIELFLRKLLYKKYLVLKIFVKKHGCELCSERMSEWMIMISVTPIRYDWGYYKQQFKLPLEKVNHVCESIFVFIETLREVFLCVPYSDISDAEFTMVKLRTL